MRRLVLLVLTPVGLVALLSGCGGDAPAAVAADVPERLVPPRVGELVVTEETGVTEAFAEAGDTSMTAAGRFFTLRRPEDRQVQAALQVSVLKPEFDTGDIEVRRGIRSFIETGRYRWFKVDGHQWVGVQELPELRLYLWFPPRGDLFEVLQVRPEVPDPEALVTQIIEYQESA